MGINKIKKLLQSKNQEDLEIALILWERKKTYFRIMVVLEWLISFPLFIGTFVSMSVSINRKKFIWASIEEIDLLLLRKDLRYIGMEMFWGDMKTIDVIPSPIGYFYLWFKKKK